jgi:hypothetical protein
VVSPGTPLGLAGGGGSGPVSPSGAPAGPSDVLPAGGSWTVTLLTGDVIDVRSDAEGRVTAAAREHAGPFRTVRMHVSGELDIATAPRLAEAMAWPRFRSCPATTILIDTSDVDFIAAAGYRALIAALVGPDGLWDPRVTLAVGPAVARLEAAISSASAGSAEQRHPPDVPPYRRAHG